MATSVERFAARLMDLERHIRVLQTQPQLAHSSIEDGAVNIYLDDSLREVVGRLADGTVGAQSVNGPASPVPSQPICSSTPRGFTIRWDGNNADGTDVQPLDWHRTEVHVSTVAVFTPDLTTLKGTIESPRGGIYTFVASAAQVQAQATFYVALVSRNTSGVASAASTTTTINAGKVDAFDIVAELTLGVGQKIVLGDPDGEHIEMRGGTSADFRFYTGHASEVAYGLMKVDDTAHVSYPSDPNKRRGEIKFIPPKLSTIADEPLFSLQGNAVDGSEKSLAHLEAAEVLIKATEVGRAVNILGPTTGNTQGVSIQSGAAWISMIPVTGTIVRGKLFALDGLELQGGTGLKVVGNLEVTGKATSIFPVVRARQATAQVAPTANTWTKIDYDTEDEDTHAAFDAATSTFTVPTGWGGIWMIVGGIAVMGRTASHPIYVRFQKNAANAVGRFVVPAHSGGGVEFQMTRLFRLVAGDTITVEHYQEATTSAFTVTTEVASTFEAMWVRK